MTTAEETIAQLKPYAVRASLNSYAPYSRFRVGAALLDEKGVVYAGCNVENASYGLTQCAERNALNAAIAAGSQPGTLGPLLIYTPGDRVHPPCGACRQVMHELMPEHMPVISCCDSGDYQVWLREEHLPGAFGPGNL
jgi:cytidine deaminase